MPAGPDHVADNDLFLSPTAEVQVTNLHIDQILDARGAAAAVHRVLAVLSRRGRRRRQGHARPDPPAPVRQGRARQARRRPRPATASSRRCARTPSACSRASACTIASSRCAPATSASAPRRPTTSRSGCPARTPIARSRRARTSRTSRRGARRSAIGRAPATSRGRSTRSTAPGIAVGRTIVAILEQYQQADGVGGRARRARVRTWGLERIDARLTGASKFPDPALQGERDPYTAALPLGPPGGVAEWSKAAVLKTAERKLRGFESLLLRRLLDNRIVSRKWSWAGRRRSRRRPGPNDILVFGLERLANSWRDGRVAEGTGLLNRRTGFYWYRGFESLSLRRWQQVAVECS